MIKIVYLLKYFYSCSIGLITGLNKILGWTNLLNNSTFLKKFFVIFAVTVLGEAFFFFKFFFCFATFHHFNDSNFFCRFFKKKKVFKIVGQKFWILRIKFLVGKIHNPMWNLPIMPKDFQKLVFILNVCRFDSIKPKIYWYQNYMWAIPVVRHCCDERTTFPARLGKSIIFHIESNIFVYIWLWGSLFKVWQLKFIQNI